MTPSLAYLAVEHFLVMITIPSSRQCHLSCPLEESPGFVDVLPPPKCCKLRLPTLCTVPVPGLAVVPHMQ
jgi:hypothetical protein